MELATFKGSAAMHLPFAIQCTYSTEITTFRKPDGSMAHEHTLRVPARELGELSNGVRHYRTEDDTDFFAHQNPDKTEWYFLLEAEPPFKVGDIVATYSWYESNIVIDRLKNTPVPYHAGWACNEGNHNGSSKDFRIATVDDFHRALTFWTEQKNYADSKIQYLEELQQEAVLKHGLHIDQPNNNDPGDDTGNCPDPGIPEIN